MALSFAEIGLSFYIMGLSLIGGFTGNLLAGILVSRARIRSFTYKELKWYLAIFFITAIVFIILGVLVMHST
jgi:hypothetical protein